MIKVLKTLAPLFFAILSYFPFQICLSQAADDETQEKSEVNGNKTMCLETEKRPVKMTLTILPVAQGYEEVYRRFLNGALIYRPNGDGNDNGMITLPIRNVGNPLEGTFDLSRCGDTGKYLSISTGYRKGKNFQNASKVEIWLAPRFLIEKELNATAKYFQPIYGAWKEQAEVGVFWTRGAWDDLTWYDYLTTQNMNDLSKNNLYEKWRWSKRRVGGRGPDEIRGAAKFHVHFVN